MRLEIAGVEMMHALHDVVEEGEAEEFVEFDLGILEYVHETSTHTVLRDDQDVVCVNARTNERVHVVVAKVSYLVVKVKEYVVVSQPTHGPWICCLI